MRSLSIVIITSAFIGMVLALQTAYALEDFGGKLFVGTIVSLSLVRELAPVLMSLMVGGRVGAGMTAELGHDESDRADRRAARAGDESRAQAGRAARRGHARSCSRC